MNTLYKYKILPALQFGMKGNTFMNKINRVMNEADIEKNKKLVLLYEKLIYEAENNVELINDLIRIGLSPDQATKASLMITGRIIKKMQTN